MSSLSLRFKHQITAIVDNTAPRLPDTDHIIIQPVGKLSLDTVRGKLTQRVRLEFRGILLLIGSNDVHELSNVPLRMVKLVKYIWSITPGVPIIFSHALPNTTHSREEARDINNLNHLIEDSVETIGLKTVRVCKCTQLFYSDCGEIREALFSGGGLINNKGRKVLLRAFIKSFREIKQFQDIPPM